ncbi:MAG: N-acetylmuramoyl-L-alanine amidase family protein [Candidatus Aminicenantales bacterium]
MNSKKTKQLQIAFVVSLFFSSLPSASAQPEIRLSAQDHDGFSRVLITFPSRFSSSLEKVESFLQVKIRTGKTFRLKSDALASGFIKSFSWVRSNQFFIIVIEARHSRFRYDSFALDKSRQLAIDFYPLDEVSQEGAAKREETPISEKTLPEEPPHFPAVEAASGTKVGPSSLGGIKTVVIDPGHGGIETGAKGKFGTLEKDITLAIGLRLKRIIERNLAFRVEMTRDKDIDISLENRAATANNHKADLFISIHTNSSYRRNAQGSETFFLSLNATDEEARRLAYLENTSAELERPLVEDSKDEIKMILWDMAQSAYLKQSQSLAEFIQNELNSLLGTTNRGIKQAPFKVLTGVACPAVLVEVAFISNPEEERELVKEGFQESVAEAIYRALVRYLKIAG